MPLNEMRFLRRQDIDTKKWDECISQSLNRMIYGFSWYLDSVSPDWSALVMSDYEAVMPLTKRKKWGISYLYQPYFMQQAGIFCKQSITQQLTNDFLASIPASYRYIDININEMQTEFNYYSFHTKCRRNIILSLHTSYSELEHNFSENCIRNIKKINNQLYLTKTSVPDNIIRLFRENRGLELNHLKKSDYETLTKLCNQLFENDCGEILEVKKDNQTIAGAILAKYKQRIIFLFSGMNNAYRDDRPMFFLINEVLKKYAGQDMIFDFEGSDNDSLARFYRGFGGSEKFYLNLKRNSLPTLLKWFKK